MAERGGRRCVVCTPDFPYKIGLPGGDVVVKGDAWDAPNKRPQDFPTPSFMQPANTRGTLYGLRYREDN